MREEITLKQQSMLEEVLAGMRRSQKRLPTKYLYDERGSKLFEQITRLQEYYLTRTEKSILTENIEDITQTIGSRAVLIELGSGSSKKTRLLLEQLPSLVAYLPVDISEEYLLKVTGRLRQDYPEILIKPVYADYTAAFELPDVNKSYEKQLVFFPGSTIGNFRAEQAREFLGNLATLTDERARMLVGVDLKKDRAVMEAAYNDSEGVTSEFNKNILHRLNRELNAGFEVDSFEHKALYNEKESRIEMHLISQKEQEVKIAGELFYLDDGESIHTENSYKYSLEDFEKLVGRWFEVERVWTDEKNYFSLQYLVKK